MELLTDHRSQRFESHKNGMQPVENSLYQAGNFILLAACFLPSGHSTPRLIPFLRVVLDKGAGSCGFKRFFVMWTVQGWNAIRRPFANLFTYPVCLSVCLYARMYYLSISLSTCLSVCLSVSATREAGKE